MEGNPLRNVFEKRKLSNTAPPPPPFFLLIGTGWTLLLPSAGIGGGGVPLGLDWAVIQIRS